MDAASPIEDQLLCAASLYDVEVTNVQTLAGIVCGDLVVRITLSVKKEACDQCAIPLIFTLAALSFSDARARGASTTWFDHDDQFTATDLLRYLRFEDGRLGLYVHYLRGRCVNTRIVVDNEGNVSLETVGRGQAATRWVNRLRGQETIRVVGAELDDCG